MKKNECILLREYLLHQLAFYQAEERNQLDHIRYTRCDSLDLYELARAKDNYNLFLQVARDLMVLLKLVEDKEDFDFQYADFLEALRLEELKRRKNRGL